jgi:membrane-associated phospholipid phosphatase
MFGSHSPAGWHFWHLVTRLGEAQLVLPLALWVAASLARDPQARPRAWRWIALVAVAALITAASKVAFIGWGIGSAALNFTGISGHAMFAAAVYPPAMVAIAAGASARTRGAAVVAGCVLALLVGVSRVVLQTHSVSEIVAGWLVGGLVSLRVIGGGIAVPAALNAAVLAGAAFWVIVMPATARSFDSHSLITRLALHLSGHQQPFTRRALLNGQV